MSIPSDGGRRRFRVDGLGGRPGWLGRPFSGRAFVVAAVATILALWGGLYLAFANWRAGIEERIAFGRAEVVPAIGPLADAVPPGVDPAEWAAAIEATRALLVEVVGTGRLDRPAMIALRDNLADRAGRARPETARAVLAGIWDDMTARLGRIRGDLGRPALLPPPPAETDRRPDPGEPSR